MNFMPMIMFMMLLSVYFLPTIIAIIKNNNKTKVILFNIFLGWTMVMWIISLVWAFKRDEEEKPQVQYVPVQFIQPIQPGQPVQYVPVQPTQPGQPVQYVAVQPTQPVQQDTPTETK